MTLTYELDLDRVNMNQISTSKVISIESYRQNTEIHTSIPSVNCNCNRNSKSKAARLTNRKMTVTETFLNAQVLSREIHATVLVLLHPPLGRQQSKVNCWPILQSCEFIHTDLWAQLLDSASSKVPLLAPVAQDHWS